jgi:hypothetical protein
MSVLVCDPNRTSPLPHPSNRPFWTSHAWTNLYDGYIIRLGLWKKDCDLSWNDAIVCLLKGNKIMNIEFKNQLQIPTFHPRFLFKGYSTDRSRYFSLSFKEQTITLVVQVFFQKMNLTISRNFGKLREIPKKNLFVVICVSWKTVSQDHKVSTNSNVKEISQKCQIQTIINDEQLWIIRMITNDYKQLWQLWMIGNNYKQLQMIIKWL